MLFPSARAGELWVALIPELPAASVNFTPFAANASRLAFNVAVDVPPVLAVRAGRLLLPCFLLRSGGAPGLEDGGDHLGDDDQGAESQKCSDHQGAVVFPAPRRREGGGSHA